MRKILSKGLVETNEVPDFRKGLLSDNGGRNSKQKFLFF